MTGGLDWLVATDAVRWLAGAPDVLGELAARLDQSAGVVEQVRGALRVTLGETAVTLGWSGRAADRANAAAHDRCDQLDSLYGVLTALARTLCGAAREFGEAHEDLRHLTVHVVPDPLDPLASVVLIREVERLADRVVATDIRRAAEVDGLADCLAGLARPVYAGQWLASAVPAGAAPILEVHGVVAGALAAEISAWAAALPAGEAGAAALRRRLAALPVAELATVVEANPSIAARLADPEETSTAIAAAASGERHGGPLQGGSPRRSASDPLDVRPDQSAATSVGAPIPAAIATALLMKPGPARVTAVHDAARALPATTRQRLALLYPRAIGSANGMPLADRVAANRVLVVAALDGELRRRSGVLSRLDDRDNHSGPIDLLRDEAGRLWDRVDDAAPISSFVDDFEGDPSNAAAGSEARIALYRSALESDRQVLAFDERGDGVLVELFGTLDDRTQSVAVLVPGTGIDLDSYSTWADLARDFHASADGLAVVAWLGGDFPDTLTAAALSSYAEDDAPRLRDFVAGMEVPASASATVLGYSYGGAVVGVAEREGLVADRVLHVESAGAGAGVDRLGDYAGGVSEHYTMTAPGDPIRLVRGVQVGGLGHGADPDDMAGFVSAPTGCYAPDDPEHPGERIDGLSAHWDVFSRRSTAWQSMVAVMTGGPLPEAAACRS